MKEDADLADRLQLGHIRSQKDAVDRAAGQRDVVAQQRGIIDHRCSPSGFATLGGYIERGPRLRSPLPSRPTSAV